MRRRERLERARRRAMSLGSTKSTTSASKAHKKKLWRQNWSSLSLKALEEEQTGELLSLSLSLSLSPRTTTSQERDASVFRKDHGTVGFSANQRAARLGHATPIWGRRFPRCTSRAIFKWRKRRPFSIGQRKNIHLRHIPRFAQYNIYGRPGGL